MGRRSVGGLGGFQGGKKKQFLLLIFCPTIARSTSIVGMACCGVVGDQIRLTLIEGCIIVSSLGGKGPLFNSRFLHRRLQVGLGKFSIVLLILI